MPRAKKLIFTSTESLILVARIYIYFAADAHNAIISYYYLRYEEKIK